MGMLIGQAHSSERFVFDNINNEAELTLKLTTYLDCSPVIVVRSKEYR